MDSVRLLCARGVDLYHFCFALMLYLCIHVNRQLPRVRGILSDASYNATQPQAPLFPRHPHSWRRRPSHCWFNLPGVNQYSSTTINTDPFTLFSKCSSKRSNQEYFPTLAPPHLNRSPYPSRIPRLSSQHFLRNPRFNSRPTALRVPPPPLRSLGTTLREKRQSSALSTSRRP